VCTLCKALLTVIQGTKEHFNEQALIQFNFLVSMLLEMKRDMEKYEKDSLAEVDNDGNTLLMNALKSYTLNEELATYLLSKCSKEDINIKNNNGENVLFSFLDSRGGKKKSQKLKFVRLLLEHGADPNLTTNDKKTAIVPACKLEGELATQVLGILREFGADVSQQHEAFFTAIEYGRIDLVKFLLEQNPDYLNKLEGWRENSALHVACSAREPNIELVKFFIQQRDDFLSARNSQGEYPLHAAVDKGNLDIIKIILEHEKGKETLDKKNDHKVSPLISAISQKWDYKEEVVMCLIEQGANLNITDKSGKTSLIRACKKGYMEVIKKLLEKGVDKDVKDKKGKTAEDYAKEKHYTEIVELLKNYKPPS